MMVNKLIVRILKIKSNINLSKNIVINSVIAPKIWVDMYLVQTYVVKLIHDMTKIHENVFKCLC